MIPNTKRKNAMIIRMIPNIYMFFRKSILTIANPELNITTKDLKNAKNVLTFANFVLSKASLSPYDI